MRISDWSSDVCSSDLVGVIEVASAGALGRDTQFDRTQRAARRPAEGVGRSAGLALARGGREDRIAVAVNARLDIVLDLRLQIGTEDIEGEFGNRLPRDAAVDAIFVEIGRASCR